MENLEPACKGVAVVIFITNVVTPLFDTTFRLALEAPPTSHPMVTRVHSTREKEPEMLN
jgi:hypothetical protein